MVLTRVGILGGTFDPVHTGHLAIARRVRESAALDRVLFIPAGNPRLKSEEPSAGPADRLGMLRLAVAGQQGFEVSDLEINRSGPTRTVDTLAELRESVAQDSELFFIMGLDVVGRLDEWIEPERVVGLARIIVVSRPGYLGFDWDDFYRRNPYALGRVDCVESATDVSASELRQRLSAGAPTGGLLHPDVEQYIRDHGLYGA